MPAAGLYEPRRGFGKLWREKQDVRECLGYARTAEETAYTLMVQPFREVVGEPNLLLTAITTEGRFIYAVYNDINRGPCRPGPCRATYERYPDPTR